MAHLHPGFQQEDRDLHEVADFVGRAAVDQVADEPVPVGGHGDEVDGVGLCELDDLG